MTQLTPPESTNNHCSETELLSFVKRGKLWVPDTVQRRSLLQRVWGWTGFGEKKLWDVLQLLIVPTALAIGAFYLQETAKQRDLQIADDRAKQETLNRYFDQISTLLFEHKLRIENAGNEARTVARARTLIALRELDGKRKGQLIRFLSEAQLIKRKTKFLAKDKITRDLIRFRPILDLSGANLSETDLSYAYLWEADLVGVDLHGADLRNARLRGANLKANLIGANLSNSDLEKANLSGVVLYGVDLTGSYLGETNFYAADLRGATFGFNSMLEKALLCQTTMPDGTKSDRDCAKLKQRERS